MENFDRKKHWENIYQTKELKDVSWFQPKPETSLNFFRQFAIPTSAKVIDVGGGDSLLADHLLALGYEDITVLDISEAAVERAKQRLSEKADKVKWLVADVSDFNPTMKYDFWHDRAAFHFLTDQDEINNYVKTAHENINPGGIMVIGTFSELGPKKCSGIDIRQYTAESLSEVFQHGFEKLSCITADHMTPFDTVQNFVFCSFRKKPEE